MGDSFWFIISQGRKMRFARASAMGLLRPSRKPDLVRYLTSAMQFHSVHMTSEQFVACGPANFKYHQDVDNDNFG